jgi:hypothetical protein
MKLSGRETTLILVMLVVLMLLGYYLFLLSPAQKKLAVLEDELTTVENTKIQNDAIIVKQKDLEKQISESKDQASKIETTLLPAIRSEAITQKLQAAFVGGGIPFITECSSEPVVQDQILMPDGTFSDNQLVSVLFKIKASGSDGVAPTILDQSVGGTPALVGYNQFIKAVKDIEDDNPESVRINSISFEDSGQGFMFYTATIEVLAFSLPDRISAANMEQEYIVWGGTKISSITNDGTVGIPFSNVPVSQFDIDAFRPFSIIAPELVPEYAALAALADLAEEAALQQQFLQ